MNRITNEKALNRQCTFYNAVSEAMKPPPQSTIVESMRSPNTRSGQVNILFALGNQLNQLALKSAVSGISV